MGDFKTYQTKEEAEQEIATLPQGWKAVKQLYLPGDPNANLKGDVWVICVYARNGDPQYLRTDGFVR